MRPLLPRAQTTTNASEGTSRRAVPNDAARARTGPIAWGPARLALGALLAAVLLWIGVSHIVAKAVPRTAGPIYSVAALRAHLAHEPAAWLYRPLRVRAVAERCMAWAGTAGTPCLDAQPTLLDAQAAESPSYLLLGWASPAPFLAVLRRLPVLGRFVPALPPVRWGIPAVYGVELVALPPAIPGAQGPYEALLDAEP